MVYSVQNWNPVRLYEVYVLILTQLLRAVKDYIKKYDKNILNFLMNVRI
jgi:hypothetical protein